MPGPMGRPGGKMETEKPKNFKETTKKLINGYLSKYKLALIIVFIFAIGSTIFTIVGPKILGNATTEIFNGLIGKLSGGNGIDFGKIGSNCFNIIRFIYCECYFFFIQVLQ